MTHVKVKPPVKQTPVRRLYDCSTFPKLAEQYRQNWSVEVIDLPYLGQGLDKVVFKLTNSLALKLSRSSYAGNQVEREVKRWLSAPKELRQYLAPIVDWDRDSFQWSVQRLCKPSLDSQVKDKLATEVSKFNVSDVHNGNVGLLDGRPVVFDYAL